MFVMIAVLLPLQEGSSNEKQIASQENIEALVKQLGSDDPQSRENAHSELMRIGMPAAKELRNALASKDVEVRVRAAELLDYIEFEVGVKKLEQKVVEMNNSTEGKDIYRGARYSLSEIVDEGVKEQFPNFRLFVIKDKARSLSGQKLLVHAVKRAENEPLDLTKTKDFERMCIESALKFEKEDDVRAFVEFFEIKMFETIKYTSGPNTRTEIKMDVKKTTSGFTGQVRRDQYIMSSKRSEYITYEFRLDKEGKVVGAKRTWKNN